MIAPGSWRRAIGLDITLPEGRIGGLRPKRMVGRLASDRGRGFSMSLEYHQDVRDLMAPTGRIQLETNKRFDK